MIEVDRSDLKTMAVRAFEASFDSDYFYRIWSQDGGPGLHLVDPPISITALFGSSDSETLKKVYLPNPTYPLDESAAVRHSLGQFFASSPLLSSEKPNKVFVESVKRAREAYFDDLPSRDGSGSAHLLGAMAIHEEIEYEVRTIPGYDGHALEPNAIASTVVLAPRPFIIRFLQDNPFAHALDKSTSELLGQGSAEQSALRDSYGMLSEHTDLFENLEGYEAFLDQLRHERDGGYSNMSLKIASSMLVMAMLPAKYTHPVIQAELFA